jgi:hypothetical protein
MVLSLPRQLVFSGLFIVAIFFDKTLGLRITLKFHRLKYVDSLAINLLLIWSYLQLTYHLLMEQHILDTNAEKQQSQAATDA